MKLKIEEVEKSEEVLVIATDGLCRKVGGRRGQVQVQSSRREQISYCVAHGALGGGPTCTVAQKTVAVFGHFVMFRL